MADQLTPEQIAELKNKKEKDLQSKYGLTGAAIKGIAGSLQKMGLSSVSLMI
jgi:ribosomal protein L11